MILEYLIVTLILSSAIYYFFICPNYKLKRIQSQVVLEVDGATIRYQDLPLGNLGILCEINKKQKRIQVVLPKLTADGDVQYICSWHHLQAVHIPKKNWF